MINALKSVRLMSSSSVKQAVSELSVPVPWGEIRGRVWGPEHGSPVLCLHGWADNSGTFNTLLPLLPKDCRYVAMDLAGHGCSSHRPPGVLYSFPSYVMDVRRVVEGVLLAGNKSLTAESAKILLERGLVPAEGGIYSCSFYSLIFRIGLEQSLELLSRIQASVLVVLAEDGFERMFSETEEREFTSALLQAYRDRNHAVATVPGNHHVHLNNPENVAPLVSDFLQTKVLSLSSRLTDGQISKPLTSQPALAANAHLLVTCWSLKTVVKTSYMFTLVYIDFTLEVAA
uniref:Serine hydrolase like n=1 Tax=Oryzias sinensis TaxID=183150 RepID=A0A8C7ZUR6_9TELE